MILRAISIIGLLITACFPVLGQQKGTYSLLWEISGKGMKNPSYLIGTIHLTDSRVFNLPDSAIIAFNNAEVFAMEVHPDSIMEYMMKDLSVFNTKFKFSDHLDYNQYRDLQKEVREVTGITDLSLDDYGIHTLKSMIENKVNTAGGESTILDMHFFRMSQVQEKPTYGLEPVSTQMDLLNDLSQFEDLASIREYLGLGPEYKAMMDTMLSLYVQGDIEAINSWMNAYSRDDKEEFMDALLYKRNKVMAESIQQIIKTQSGFFAVGAAHLPGKDGLIDLLTGAGYKLRPVKATYTGMAANFKYVADTSKGWVAFDVPGKDYSMDFPGKPSLVENYMKMGLDGYMYTDLRDMTIYLTMCIPLPTEVTGENLEQMKQVMSETFAGKATTSGDVAFEDISRLGNSGLKMYVPLNGDTMLMEMIFAGKRLVLNFAGREGSNITADVAERFMSSLKLQEPGEVMMQELTSEAGAFSATLPNNYKYTRFNVDVSNEGTIVAHAYLAIDNQTGSTYLLRYSDLPYGRYIPDPYDHIRQNFTELAGRLNMTITDTTWFLTDMKYPSLRFTGTDQRENVVIGKMIARGNRQYLAVHAGSAENTGTYETNILLNSLKLTDYKPVEWKKFTDDTLGFEIMLPDGVMEINKRPSSSYSTSDSVFEYIVTDTFSGYSVFVIVNRYNEYFSLQSVDTLFHEIVEDNIAERLLHYEITEHNGRKMLNTVYKPGEETELNIYSATQLIGRDVFEVYALVTEDVYKSERFEKLTGSFRYTGNTGFDPLVRKTDKLLADLRSTDTVVVNKAQNNLYSYSFTSDEMPRVLDAALYTGYSDSLAEYPTAMRLLYKAKYLADSSNIGSLLDREPEFRKIPALYDDYLLVVGYLVHLGTANRLMEFVKAVPAEDSLSWYGIFYPLTYDTTVNIRELLPNLMAMVGMELRSSGILKVINDRLYDEDLKAKDLEPYMAMFPELTAKLQAYGEQTGYWFPYTRVLYTLEYLPKDKAIDDQLTAINLDVKDGYSYQHLSLFRAKLLRGLPVSKAEAKILAESDITRMGLFKAMKKAGDFSLMPKKYLKPEMLGQSDLMQLFADNGEEVESIKLMKKLDYDANGFKGKVYLYSIKLVGKEYEITGMAGVYPTTFSTETFNYGDQTTYHYRDWDSLTPEAHVEQMLYDLYED